MTEEVDPETRTRRGEIPFAEKVQALKASEQAHLARAEKCRAKWMALLQAEKDRAEAVLATVREHGESIQ